MLRAYHPNSDVPVTTADCFMYTVSQKN